jgi:hypothetical protein
MHPQQDPLKAPIPGAAGGTRVVAGLGLTGTCVAICHPPQNPVQHPDCNETEFTKDATSEFASALSSMDLSDFEPLVDSEASDKANRIARNASKSRKCPIQDAQDYWVPRRESANMGGSAPG